MAGSDGASISVCGDEFDRPTVSFNAPDGYMYAVTAR